MSALREELRRAVQRIQKLDRRTQELQKTVAQQAERLAILEAAVPWSSALSQFGLPLAARKTD